MECLYKHEGRPPNRVRHAFLLPSDLHDRATWPRLPSSTPPETHHRLRISCLPRLCRHSHRVNELVASSFNRAWATPASHIPSLAIIRPTSSSSSPPSLSHRDARSILTSPTDSSPYHTVPFEPAHVYSTSPVVVHHSSVVILTFLASPSRPDHL
jgi:hypothetical protein